MRTARRPLAPGILRATFFPGGHLPDGEAVEGTFAGLLRALAAVARPTKHGSCGWGPYSLDQSRRCNEAVEELWCDVIDVDHVPEAKWAEILKTLEPYRFAWHYTHSNVPGSGTVSARVIIPLAHAVLKGDWTSYRAQTPWAAYHDPATKDAARFYYCPPTGQAITEHDGELVDPYLIIDGSNHGYEAKIARIGDGLGRLGFQATIVPAIAAYLSAGRDTRPEALARLKQDVRERVDAAPKRHDRTAEDIGRYKSDEFLDEAIKNGIRKFAPVPLPVPADVMSEAEVKAVATGEGLDPETFMRRLVLANCSARYVWQAGTYQKASTTDSVVAMRDNLARFPIKWTDPLSGKLRGREALELDYATKISGVLYDSRIDRTAVETHNGELRLRVSVGRLRTDIKPVFSARVDSWINTTTNPTAIRAFMADVYNLDRALFALILWGPPGTGKTSFAEGLAKAWNDAPTRGSTVFPGLGKDAWTAPLLDCPLVVSDEQAPACNMRRLREFLGSDQHRLTRKYDHEATFLGYPRLVIAGNDQRVGLHLTDAEPDEIQATAVRFQSAYVPAGEKLDWAHFVRDMGLVQHALWLREKHPIARDSSGARYRFGLPPDNSFAEMLSISGETPNRVLQWLIAGLENVSAVKCLQKLYVPDTGWIRLQGATQRGHLVLSADALFREWASVAGAPYRPSLAEIGAALKTICYQVRLPGALGAPGRTVYVASPAKLTQWCAEYGADVPPVLAGLI